MASTPVTTSQPKPAPALTHRRVNNHAGMSSAQYFAPGADKPGVKSHYEKTVWYIPYQVKPGQLDALHERFPAIDFIVRGKDCHDHPIAHTSYNVVWQNTLNALPARAKVADICGNPGVNEQFMKAKARSVCAPTIDTYCKILSCKDAIRANSRWGPKMDGDRTRWTEFSLYDMYRNEENRDRFSVYTHFLMNHVIYYYTKAEINRLLNIRPGSELIATIHKLPGRSGFINCGEQEYEKDPLTGSVRLWNVETGEDYEHADPCQWFSGFSYADESGAFAWTILKGCDDTYVLRATSCPANLVPVKCWRDGVIVLRDQDGDTVTIDAVEPQIPAPAYAYPVVILDGSKLLSGRVGTSKREIRITHPDLYETLQTFMINRVRNARTLVDLTAKAHREVGNNVLIGGKKGKIKISPVALAEHIAAAFVANGPLEGELCDAALPSYASAMGGHRSAAKDTVRFLLAAKAVINSKDAAHKVLSLLDEVL
jgi:hypothetical protein